MLWSLIPTQNSPVPRTENADMFFKFQSRNLWGGSSWRLTNHIIPSQHILAYCILHYDHWWTCYLWSLIPSATNVLHAWQWTIWRFVFHLHIRLWSLISTLFWGGKPQLFPNISWKCGHFSPEVQAQYELDPKWVPERAKHSGRKIWHEMKGPWRLSPIEHNPKITNLFSRRAFLVTPRWWRSTWRFPITDHSWNVDIHARKSKRGRRANQVKSNNSRQISQVK